MIPMMRTRTTIAPMTIPTIAPVPRPESSSASFLTDLIATPVEALALAVNEIYLVSKSKVVTKLVIKLVPKMISVNSFTRT